MRVVVQIPTSNIIDWETFHDVFTSSLGFPDYYGRNENAFQDLLWYPEASDLGVEVAPGGTLLLLLEEPGEVLAKRCPQQFALLLETVAHANADRIERGGDAATLALAYR